MTGASGTEAAQGHVQMACDVICRRVVQMVQKRYPSSELLAAGWSLGGNILVRYLGEEGDQCPISAAASLCNPLDLVGACHAARPPLQLQQLPPLVLLLCLLHWLLLVWCMGIPGSFVCLTVLSSWCHVCGLRSL